MEWLNLESISTLHFISAKLDLGVTVPWEEAFPSHTWCFSDRYQQHLGQVPLTHQPHVLMMIPGQVWAGTSVSALCDILALSVPYCDNTEMLYF